MKASGRDGISPGMDAKKAIAPLAFILTTTFTSLVAAQGPNPDAVPPVREGVTKLSLFAGAGYLTTSGANGAAMTAGVRLALGNYFALGFDLGYGVLAMQSGVSVGGVTTGMEDRWWLIPSMAGVIPVHFGKIAATLDIGVGLGLGTASGYQSASEYASHPFTADWEFQLVPAARGHAIAAFSVSRTLELFARADAAALVLPHGVGTGVGDSTWLMFSLGTRFRAL